MEQVVLTFTIILWSSVKYALGAGIALYANIGLLPSISLTVGGGMLGIICFTYFGSKVRKFINNHTPHNKLRINKKTRMMVRVKNSFGLPGIAFLTPVLLSIPVGVLMATALTSKQTDLIILAVKPQDAEGLYEELKTHIIPRHVVLSIMAGKTIASIQKALNVTKVVRAMPNLPCQIGMGMTAFTASPDVDRRSLIEVQNLINTTGKSIYFDDETQLDAVTALSGSGPAYIFYCMEAMISAGKKLGFTDAEAELLVQQTFVGSVHLKLRNELTPSEWISKVTSKGGTTEAALNVFSKRDLSGNMTEGISAAFKRSRELGG